MKRTPESGLLGGRGGLSLDRLRSYLSVVDAGGFARAAPGDPSRQSQLSRQVRDLERALGAELLVREGRGVAPTGAGLRLQAVLRELGEGLREVKRLDKQGFPEVTVAAGDSLLQWLVLPSLGAAPAWTHSARASLFASSDPLGELVSGRAHVALVRARPMPTGLSAKACGSLGFALFVPRALARTGNDLGKVLSRVALVGVSADTEPFERLVLAMGRPLVAALTCETFPQAARAVATGRYAALLPSIAASELPPTVATAFAVPGLRPMASRLVLVARTRALEARPALAETFDRLRTALRERLD